MNADADPVCTVLGGTNGSGKSSLYHRLTLSGEFINADVIARQINPTHPETASFAAGKRVLRRLDELVRTKQGFVYETTLSGRQPLELMKLAKRNGYRIDLAFVVLASIDLNVERVAQRVALGGHDIPETTIRRRYGSSLTRLGEAIHLADYTAIFDNTTRELITLARFAKGTLLDYNLDDVVPTHVLLAKALADVLGR